MIDQKDLDCINDTLYSLTVPDEPLKKIMFYFTVLKNVIDFPFPENYINFDHPYFKTYYRMEEFLSLAQCLNPDFLHQKNVIIYHDEKAFYEYYQQNGEQNRIPYEFKVIDAADSINPIFKSNYKNNFNIRNINPNQKEFDITFTNKANFPNSEIADNNTEEHYYNDDNNFQLDESHRLYSLYEDSSQPAPNFLDIQDYFDENEIQKNSELALATFAYANQINPTEESENREYASDSINVTMTYSKKIEIKNKLVVSRDWIDFIYRQPIKSLNYGMKTVIKGEDIIRSRSISLPKNIFFYLEFIALAGLVVCSSLLLAYGAGLRNDDKFRHYEGKNDTDFFFPILSSGIQFFKNSVDYSNDTFIVPDKKKYKHIKICCQFGEVSAIFGIIYFIFIIYMCIRVCRENKKKYQKKAFKNEAGLNMFHVFALIFLTMIVILMSLMAEIALIIPLAIRTYDFIHKSVTKQLILNSFLFVDYLLIQIFYCKI